MLNATSVAQLGTLKATTVRIAVQEWSVSDMEDLINRQAAIDAIEKHLHGVLGEREYELGVAHGYQLAHRHIQYVIAQLPSAQQWHVITKTPMTEEERKEWSERLGYDIEYDEAFIYGNLPDDGEEVLVSTHYGRVYIDTFCQDAGCYFEEYGDMSRIVAWTELPEPYREGKGTDNTDGQE